MNKYPNNMDISALLPKKDDELSCPIEKALNCNKSNKFFESLIRSLPGIFYLIDENHQILSWNDNAQHITGYSLDEESSANLTDLFYKDDWELINKTIKTAFANGKASVEARVASNDGNKVAYSFTGATVDIGQKHYLLGVGLDISEFKKIENSLRESIVLYTFFAERVPEGMLLTQNYRPVFANKTFRSILEYDDSVQLESMKIIDLIDEEFLPEFKSIYETIETGVDNKKSFQVRGTTNKGRTIWIEGNGSATQWKGERTVILMFRDITKTKLNEILNQEESESLERENLQLRSTLNERFRFGSIIGKSSLMQAVYESILNAARVSANIIVTGESGTGKELVAREIHDRSDRCSHEFVTVNCAAIPEHLLESEFFGHKKGAFTGASSNRIGYLEQANGGTLFLDEVAELNINLQAKLLRAIDGGGFTPVGENRAKNSNFRIIAATHRNLEECVEKGMMRRDFYYRIHIVPITLPSLRDRRTDITLLVEHFLSIYEIGDDVQPITGLMMDALINYHWPGNVRELRNSIQRYIAEKSFDFILSEAKEPLSIPGETMVIRRDLPLRKQVQDLEVVLIKEQLTRLKGNRSKTAEALGITRKTLFRKMNAYELDYK